MYSYLRKVGVFFRRPDRCTGLSAAKMTLWGVLIGITLVACTSEAPESKLEFPGSGNFITPGTDDGGGQPLDTSGDSLVPNDTLPEFDPGSTPITDGSVGDFGAIDTAVDDFGPELDVVDPPDSQLPTDSMTGDVPDPVDVGTIPIDELLCRPCTSQSECPGGACVVYGPSGSFCATPCDNGCTDGAQCGSANLIGSTESYDGCLWVQGDCFCTELFVLAAAKTTCYVDNDFGLCSGSRFCTALTTTATAGSTKRLPIRTVIT
ncbi:MAG: hypothetical protein HUU55_21750 [Myxococcales bacterium]|nr:hypothetical protein [Myxococcales bacterium]